MVDERNPPRIYIETRRINMETGSLPVLQPPSGSPLRGRTLAPGFSPKNPLNFPYTGSDKDYAFLRPSQLPLYGE